MVTGNFTRLSAGRAGFCAKSVQTSGESAKSLVKVVRIAGLEPAHLSALPPQSSVSANSTICALKGFVFCLMRSRMQAISAAQHPVPAAPAPGLPGVEAGAVRFFQVILDQHADAIGAAPVGAEGVNAVGVGDDALEPVGGRAI